MAGVLEVWLREVVEALEVVVVVGMVSVVAGGVVGEVARGGEKPW